MLFDVSGSMEGHLPNAREAATHVLSWLDAARDEAAVYTFDTHLDERTPFTTGLRTLPDSMTQVVPFGATSLHDAIALTARRVGEREGRRRAVVVMTDGDDNASRLKPADVSAIASAIDVPVYIFGIVPSIDNPSADTVDAFGRAARRSPVRSPIWRPGPAGTCSWPARRDSAASRRGRSSTSCGISTSSHSNRAASRAGIRSWSARATRTSSFGPGVDTSRGNHARRRIRRIIMFRKFFVALPIVALAVGGSTACATKKFVRTSVGEVNEKVDSQGRAIEETQERTRKNEGRISEVDSKAQAAAQSAQAANDAAGGGERQRRRAVGTEANAKFDAIDKANKRLVYEVVLSEDQGNFKFGKTELPDEAKAKIDEMVAQMKQDPKNIYLEIEGHTDNVGDKVTNEKHRPRSAPKR